MDSQLCVNHAVCRPGAHAGCPCRVINAAAFHQIMPYGLSIPRLEGGQSGKRPGGPLREGQFCYLRKEPAIVFMRLPVDTRQGPAENIGLGRAERDAVVRIGLLLSDEVQFKSGAARR